MDHKLFCVKVESMLDIFDKVPLFICFRSVFFGSFESQRFLTIKNANKILQKTYEH